jgi:hypothetical protein
MGRSPDNHLRRLQQLSQISRLEKRNNAPFEITNDYEEDEKFDSINNETPISSPDDDGVNQAFLDELKHGIHHWKRSVKNEVSPILDEEK